MKKVLLWLAGSTLFASSGCVSQAVIDDVTLATLNYFGGVGGIIDAINGIVASI